MLQRGKAQFNSCTHASSDRRLARKVLSLQPRLLCGENSVPLHSLRAGTPGLESVGPLFRALKRLSSDAPPGLDARTIQSAGPPENEFSRTHSRALMNYFYCRPFWVNLYAVFTFAATK